MVVSEVIWGELMWLFATCDVMFSTPYYEVQYFKVLQGTTPIYYPVVQGTTLYYKVILKYYKELLRYYFKVILKYYKVIL